MRLRIDAATLFNQIWSETHVAQDAGENQRRREAERETMDFDACYCFAEICIASGGWPRARRKGPSKERFKVSQQDTAAIRIVTGRCPFLFMTPSCKTIASIPFRNVCRLENDIPFAVSLFSHSYIFTQSLCASIDIWMLGLWTQWRNRTIFFPTRRSSLFPFSSFVRRLSSFLAFS